MKVAILNNWCNDEQFFIYKLLKQLFPVELTNDPINCDILIHSVFGFDESYKHTKAKFKILTSWETRFYIDIFNERLPYSDIVISYHPTKNNFYRLPLWYQWIDWWNENSSDQVTTVCGQSHHYIGGNTLPNHLVPTPLNIRKNIYTAPSVRKRPNFCAMLVGNMEPECVAPRQEIYNELSKNIDVVSGFGLAFQNRFEGNKIELLTRFKANCCYENSIHRGYTTEKILDAIFAGCLPIYSGDPEYSKIDFNQKRFLNRQDYSSTAEFVKEVKSVMEDKFEFDDIINQPMFTDNQIPNLDGIYQFLEDKIK
jgi:hypothetical protein